MTLPELYVRIIKIKMLSFYIDLVIMYRNVNKKYSAAILLLHADSDSLLYAINGKLPHVPPGTNQKNWNSIPKWHVSLPF